MVPLIAGNNWGNDVKIEGAKDSQANNNSSYNEIGPGFFGKMGIPLIAGREFTESDIAGGAEGGHCQRDVCEALPGWPESDRRAVFGQRVRLPEITIVGVVKDSHYSSVKQTRCRPCTTRRGGRTRRSTRWIFTCATALPEKQMVPQIRRVMAIDRPRPAAGGSAHAGRADPPQHPDRPDGAATGGGLRRTGDDAGDAGLYGVMAHSVTRRTREIGIRMALGAEPGKIRVMVMRELLWILIAGLVTGVPAAMVVARYTETQLFGVKARDAVVVRARCWR